MDDVFEKAPEDSLGRKRVRNKRIRKRVLFAIIVVSLLCGSIAHHKHINKLRIYAECINLFLCLKHLLPFSDQSLNNLPRSIYGPARVCCNCL